MLSRLFEEMTLTPRPEEARATGVIRHVMGKRNKWALRCLRNAQSAGVDVSLISKPNTGHDMRIIHDG
jgi:hypothetical protein